MMETSAVVLADAPPCECDVLRVKTFGVFWCRAVVTFMCRSVAWDRGESRMSPVLVVTRHPLLGGTLEIPLADLTRPLRIISVTPRQEKRHVWSIALGSSRRKLTLRASSVAQYAKWTRLTRQWLQLGHDMSASVVTASPTATATSETTNTHRRRRRSPRRHAAAHWEFETKAIVDSPVLWDLEMLPSPLSSSSSSSPTSAHSESTTYFTATMDPPASGSRIRLDSDDNESSRGGSADQQPRDEQPPETGVTSLSVFSLLQVLQAQEASLETISSARTSADAQSDNMSIGPLSEATMDGDTALRDGASFSVDDSSGSTSTEWAHPTGRALSSASLSSWLSESDQEQEDLDDAGRCQRAQTVAMLELPSRRQSAGGSEEEEGAESFDYEASFPWIFTDAPDRRVVVITGPRPTDGGDPQTVYFF